MIDLLSGPHGVNGVLTLGGTTTPGSRLLIGLHGAAGFSAIGSATADPSGNWTFSTPANALGYGSVTLATAGLSSDWQPGPWQDATVITSADPEAALRHLGADLAAALANDAAHGLDAADHLQALTDQVLAGGPAVLDIPAGTYILGHTVILHSGTYLDAPGVTLTASSDFARPTPGDPLGYALLANANYLSDAYLDHDIQVRHVAFDWTSFDNFGSAAIRFRSVQNVMVQDATFHGGEDGTAFMHADGAVVRDSTATATVNYAFDNWEGPRNTVIANNTATVDRFSGIAFTGRGTLPGQDFTATNLAAYGNHVIGAEVAGIQVEALSTGSSVDHVFLAGNTIDGPGAGIAVTGAGTGDVIFANTLNGSMGAAELSLSRVGTAGYPLHDIIVANNTLTNATIRNAATAALVVAADTAGIFGNTVLYGSAPYGLWDAGNAVTSGGNVLSNWKTAALTTTGAGLIVSTDGPQTQTPPAAGQMAYVLSAGTLTPAGGGVLDLRANPDYASVTTLHLADSPGQTVYLGTGTGVRVTVASANAVIHGATAADTITLGPLGGTVMLGGSAEIVHGGAGDDLFWITSATAGASIDGGGGIDRVMITGGGTIVLGPTLTGIEEVRILRGAAHTSVTLNATPGLTLRAAAGGDTLTAGGPDQALFSGAGNDLLVGLPGGRTVFAGRAAELGNDLISGIGYQAAIDVTSIGFAGVSFSATADPAAGITTLSVGDRHDGTTLRLVGVFDATQFALAPDAAGTGTRITFIACYVQGTLIAIPGGERPIEDLRIGDPVCLVDGGTRRIKWIGRRRYTRADVTASPQLRPVRIRANAIADGLPRRDLLVSAPHALFIDGVLVPAAALVNGRSITRDPPGDVAYLHIALDRHDLILAEGMPAESYVDTGVRRSSPRDFPRAANKELSVW